jgi:predicted DNA-binding transcriptional regulator AlpA
VPTQKSPTKSVSDELALLRKRELATLLRVNPWTIDAWRKAGRIPQPVELSPQIVAWRRSDIARWLDERQSKSASRRKSRSQGA